MTAKPKYAFQNGPQPSNLWCFARHHLCHTQFTWVRGSWTSTHNTTLHMRRNVAREAPHSLLSLVNTEAGLDGSTAKGTAGRCCLHVTRAAEAHDAVTAREEDGLALVAKTHCALQGLSLESELFRNLPQSGERGA